VSLPWIMSRLSTVNQAIQLSAEAASRPITISTVRPARDTNSRAQENQ
jgi:hypothetical protein